MNQTRHVLLRKRALPQLVSFVIPMYNEEEIIPLLRARLDSLLSSDPGCELEFVLVDDGSSDRTIECLQEWASQCSQVKLVSLSRNFGHQIAVTAGLHFCRGEAVIIMDADLQDPPELLPEFLTGYCEGYEVVYAQRRSRKGESLFKLTTAKLFYLIMKRFISKDLPMNTGDFRLISRRVVEDIKRLNEHNRFLRGLVTWVGYSQKPLLYDRDERAAGTTKYPVLKMIRFALNAIVSFSDLPLRLITWLGFFSFLVSFAMLSWVFYMNIFETKELVPGWSSLIISIYFVAGIILISLGTIGLYIGRIYSEVLNRPLFLVQHTENIEDPKHD